MSDIAELIDVAEVEFERASTHRHRCVCCDYWYECEDEGCTARATISVCPDCLSF